MPEKKPEVFKTETQLKEEALARQVAEAATIAAKPKSAFVKKRENFWYHYKWQSLVAIFALVLLCFFIRDMFFTPKADASIVFVSQGYVDPAALDELARKIEQNAPDFNGDKKAIINFDTIALPKEAAVESSTSSSKAIPPPDLTGGQADYANNMKLVTVVAAGVDSIYLLDEAAYQHLLSMGGGEKIFVSSVPAEQVGGPQFAGLTFYLRIGDPDNKSYKYCEELMTTLNRS